MAQPISPMIWNKAAIMDNRLLPARYSIGIFTGKGVNIANNQEIFAWDEILVSDRIFDYDDRRLNGLAGINTDGTDGWSASAYGPFQNVRFTRRVFTSGQHKSIAWRIFDEKQYSGEIGSFGDASTSTATSGGESYLSTAETINRAKKLWDQQILGPHIDRYNFFAIANGHISGRFVQTNAKKGQMFDGDGQWIASPGPYEGLSIPPEFAPIKAIEWDALNVRPMLNAIDVAWTNLFIPSDNRVILLDKAYKDDLLSNLIGIPGSIPAGDKAFDALVEGRFERFMGWDFDFTIPSQYYPKVYLDSNNNVVHSADGSAAYDAVINSITAPDGVIKLQTELAEAQRVRATNYFGTYYDETAKEFKNIVTNYPFGMPAGDGYLGNKEETEDPDFSVPTDAASGGLLDFPWMGYPGQGIESATGPVGPITKRQVIGMAVYRPAAQLGEEYGNMETDRGRTRGKFTELVFDVKHDAWVIPNLSHGILLIVDAEESVGQPALKIQEADPEAVHPRAFPDGDITSFVVTPATVALEVGEIAKPVVAVDGFGGFSAGFTAASSATGVATVSAAGAITAVGVGTATITYTSAGDSTKTDTVVVTVTGVSGITVTPATATIAKDADTTPTVVVAGYGDYDDSWTAASSDTGVATVDATGKITGVAAGTATITYTAVGDGTKTDTVAVTVTE